MEERKLLMEDENMKEFLNLLDNNGLGNHKKDIEYLGKYIDQMESTLSDVLEELKSVRQELSSVQDATLKAQAIKAVDKVTYKVEDVKKMVIEIKNYIKDTVKQTVCDFKDKGKSALVTALNKIHVKGLLNSIESSLNHVVESTNKEVSKLDKIYDEIHVTKGHLKNIGRLLIGKEAALIDYGDNKGLISKV